MLAAILAILGVAFVGTIGIGAVSSLIQNRRGRDDTSSAESSDPEQEDKPKTKKKKREKEPEREEEKSDEIEETRDDLGFIKRPKKKDPVGVDEEQDVEEVPEETVTEEPKKTKEDFIQIVDLVRGQMLADTDEYYRMVDEKVKSMKLDPATEEHRAIVAETMKRDWDNHIKGLNNYLDSRLSILTEENADQIYNDSDAFFDRNYSLERRIAFVTKPGGAVERASSKYRIYEEKIRKSGIYSFMDRTENSMSPQVILHREHITAMTRKYLGDIVNGTTSKVDEFDRNLTVSIADVRESMSTADSIVSLYNDVFNQGERIADLEAFRTSVEKWIESTDQELQSMAEKLDFEALSRMTQDVEKLKAKLEGIGENETVVGKLKELEKNIGKAYAKKFEDIEKAISDSNKKVADIEKELTAVRNSLKAKVNSATMTSKFKALETRLTELETKLSERLDKMAEEIALLTEKVDGNNNPDINKLLEEKLSEFLESDQGMLMFANNFAKMMKSKDPEVKRIVETAIIDKIKRYLNTKGGKEKFDPIIINKINNVIVNNPDVTNNIVNIVIQKIQEGQIVIGGDTKREDGNVYITVNGDVYGVNMAGVLEEAVKSITINGDVIGINPNQNGKGSKK